MTKFDGLKKRLNGSVVDWEVWHDINVYAWVQGWIHLEDYDTNTALIWAAQSSGRSDHLIPVALSMMLEGWAYGIISEKLRGCIGYVHNNEAAYSGATTKNPKKRWYETRADYLAAALMLAILEARQ